MTTKITITDLQNEFASYKDIALCVDISIHEDTEINFMALDNFGESNYFQLAFSRTQFHVQLSLLLPGNIPDREIALSTDAGEVETGGELQYAGQSTPLFTGFAGQITDTWCGNITVKALTGEAG